VSDGPEQAPQAVQEVLEAHHATLEELSEAVNSLLKLVPAIQIMQDKIEELETRLEQRIIRPGAGVKVKRIMQ